MSDGPRDSDLEFWHAKGKPAPVEKMGKAVGVWSRVKVPMYRGDPKPKVGTVRRVGDDGYVDVELDSPEYGPFPILRVPVSYVELTEEPKRAMTLDELQYESHQTAVEHGWWETERNIGEILALIHSEISEALEEYRQHGLSRVRYETDSEGKPKPAGFFVELADAVIRIADIFEQQGVSMEFILRLKMDYNKTRPYRHGGKRA